MGQLASHKPALASAVQDLGRSDLRKRSIAVCSISLVVYTIMHPLVGKISDRIGRRSLLLGAAFGLTVLAYPIFLLLNTAHYVAILVGLVAFAVLVSITAVMDVVLLVEVFPASIRSTGAAIWHNVALAILAGPGPYIADELIRHTHNPNIPAWYLSVISARYGIVLWRMLPETKVRDISQGQFP